MDLNILKKIDPDLAIIYDKNSSVSRISAITDILPKSVVFIGDKKVLASFRNIVTPVEMIVLDKMLEDQTSWIDCKCLIVTSNFNELFTGLSKYFYDLNYLPLLSDHEQVLAINGVNISNDAFVNKNTIIGEGTIIHSGAVIMAGTTIGKNCEIFSNVVIYPNTQIGNNCKLFPGVVIGADGFGFKTVKGEHRRLWHTGGVIIKDNVEIGSLSAIDAGTFSPTFIDSGTIIGKLVQIGHNCKIGKNCYFAPQSGLAGSSNVGDNVHLDIRAGVISGATVGSNSYLHYSSVATRDFPPMSRLSGYPAISEEEWNKLQSKLQSLLQE